MKNNFFTLFVLILSSLFVLGCSQKSTGDLTNIMRTFSETFNSHDATAVADLYTKDAAYMVAGEPEPLRGRKAIMENYAAFFTGFPDIEVEFPLIMTSGDTIMAEGVTRGTHTGHFGDLPPTGRKIEIRFATVLEVTPDGLISEDRTYFDSSVMMSQLGLNEPVSETSVK